MVSKRFRDGNWWEKPLPTGAPVHLRNSDYLLELNGQYNGVETDGTYATDGPYYNGKKYLSFSGGADLTASQLNTDLDTPIYRVTKADPTVTLRPLDQAPDGGGGGSSLFIAQRFRAVGTSGSTGQGGLDGTGEGIRIPTVAKTYFNVETGTVPSDSPCIIYDGERGYYAHLSVLRYYPSVDKWYCQSADIYSTSSYGVSSGTQNRTTKSVDADWPGTLGGTSAVPSVYQDNVENYGGRGNNSMTRAIDFDRLTSDGIIPYVTELFAERTKNGTPTHLFPMDGSESNKGGLIPEGTRLRLKTTIDVVSEVNSNFPIGSVINGKTVTQQRRDQLIAILKGFQTYGMMVGDNSDDGCRVRLEALHREGRTYDWAICQDDLKYWPFIDDWQIIEDNYDPAVQAGTYVFQPMDTAIIPFLYSTLNTKTTTGGHDDVPTAKAITAGTAWYTLEPTKNGFSAGVLESTSIPDAHNNNYKILLRIRMGSNAPIGTGGSANWLYTDGTNPVQRLQLRKDDGTYLYVPTYFRRNNAADTSYDNYRIHRANFLQQLADYLSGACPVDSSHTRAEHIYFVPAANGDVGTEMWTGYFSTYSTYNKTQYDTWGTEAQRQAALKTAWKETIQDFAEYLYPIGVRIGWAGGALFGDGQNAAFALADDADILALKDGIVAMQTNLQVGSDGITWRSFNSRNSDWALKCIANGYEWGFQTAGSGKLGWWDTDSQKIVNAFEDARATYKAKFIESYADMFDPGNVRNTASRTTLESPPQGHTYYHVGDYWPGGTGTVFDYLFDDGNNLQTRLPAPNQAYSAAFSQTFEGVASGTVMTPTNTANSGSAFETIVGSPTYDGTYAVGTRSMKIPSGNAVVYGQWSHGIVPELWGRCLVYLTASPTATLEVAWAGNNGTRGFGIRIGTGRKLQIADSTGFKVSTSQVIPINAWVRIEWHADISTDTLTAEFYNDSTTTVVGGSITATSPSMGTSFTQQRFGNTLGGSLSAPFWIDMVSVSSLQAPGSLAPGERYTSNFNSGTNNTTITSDSSVGDGISWDFITGTPKYTTSAILGRASARFTAVTNEKHYLEWYSEPSGEHFGRAYVKTPTLLSSSSPIFRATADGTTEAFSLRISTTGILQIYDSTGLVGTSSAVISANTVNRIEWHVIVSTGSIDVKIFNSANSTTPTQTISLTNKDFGTLSTNAFLFGDDTNANYADFQTKLGRTLTARRYYGAFDAPSTWTDFGSQWCAYDTKLPPTAGNITAVRNKLTSFSRRQVVTYYAEPERRGFVAADYIADFQAWYTGISDLADVAWCLMGDTFKVSGTYYPPDDWYPGNAYVDIIAVDAYAKPINLPYPAPSTTFGNAVAFATARSKPLHVYETGILVDTAGSTSTDRVNLLKQWKTFFQANPVGVLLYFENTGPAGNFSIRNEADTMAEYASMIDTLSLVNKHGLTSYQFGISLNRSSVTYDMDEVAIEQNTAAGWIGPATVSSSSTKTTAINAVLKKGRTVASQVVASVLATTRRTKTTSVDAYLDSSTSPRKVYVLISLLNQTKKIATLIDVRIANKRTVTTSIEVLLPPHTFVNSSIDAYLSGTPRKSHSMNAILVDAHPKKTHRADAYIIDNTSSPIYNGTLDTAIAAKISKPKTRISRILNRNKVLENAPTVEINDPGDAVSNKDDAIVDGYDRSSMKWAFADGDTTTNDDYRIFPDLDKFESDKYVHRQKIPWISSQLTQATGSFSSPIVFTIQYTEPNVFNMVEVVTDQFGKGGAGVVNDATIEVSTDGSSWTTIGSGLTSENSVERHKLQLFYYLDQSNAQTPTWSLSRDDFISNSDGYALATVSYTWLKVTVNSITVNSTIAADYRRAQFYEVGAYLWDVGLQDVNITSVGINENRDLSSNTLSPVGASAANTFSIEATIAEKAMPYYNDFVNPYSSNHDKYRDAVYLIEMGFDVGGGSIVYLPYGTFVADDLTLGAPQGSVSISGRDYSKLLEQTRMPDMIYLDTKLEEVIRDIVERAGIEYYEVDNTDYTLEDLSPGWQDEFWSDDVEKRTYESNVIWTHEQTCWEFLQSVAYADLGVFYFDRNNVFIYKSKEDLLRGQEDSAYTLSEDDDIFNFNTRNEIMKNAFTINYRVPERTKDPVDVWETTETIALSVTALAEDISNDQRSIPVGDIKDWQKQGYFQIGNEIIKYNNKNDNTFLECERGWLGTDPTFHNVSNDSSQWNLGDGSWVVGGGVLTATNNGFAGSDKNYDVTLSHNTVAGDSYNFYGTVTINEYPYAAAFIVLAQNANNHYRVVFKAKKGATYAGAEKQDTDYIYEIWQVSGGTATLLKGIPYDKAPQTILTGVPSKVKVQVNNDEITLWVNHHKVIHYTIKENDLSIDTPAKIGFGARGSGPTVFEAVWVATLPEDKGGEQVVFSDVFGKPILEIRKLDMTYSPHRGDNSAFDVPCWGVRYYSTNVHEIQVIMFSAGPFSATAYVKNENPLAGMFSGYAIVTGDGNNDDRVDEVFYLTGYALNKEPEQQFVDKENEDLIIRYGRQEMIANLPWVESKQHATKLLKYLETVYSKPVLFLNTGISPNPRIEIGDIVSIVSTGGEVWFPTTEHKFYVVGNNLSFGLGGMTQTLDLRSVT